MGEKCSLCGEELAIGMDGALKCKNGHEKKKQMKHYTYPLGDEGSPYKRGY